MSIRVVTESELRQEFGEEWRDEFTNKEAAEIFKTDILIIRYETSKSCRTNTTTEGGSDGAVLGNTEEL